MKSKLLVLIGLIAVAISTRFIPHAPNFTAVGAVALFSGVVFKNHLRAISIPLTALFLSDLVLNNLMFSEYYEGFTLFTRGFVWIYAAFIITTLIGHFGVSKEGAMPLLGAGISSALLFYILTNFGAWMGNPLYTQDFSGLMTAYIAGLPFLLNQVLGTLFYGAVLFGAAYAFAGYRFPKAANA